MAYIADTGWRAWHKPLRFLWRSFCWYLVYSAVMYILMLGSYVAALPSEVQSCMPAMILTWALENRVFLYLPVVVALAVGQVVFGLYFGWRSMDDSFWTKWHLFPRAAFLIYASVMVLQLVLNIDGLPWVAMRLAVHWCTAA